MATHIDMALVPVGAVDPAVLGWLKGDLPGILTATVEEFPPVPLPPRHFRKERSQYLADGILSDFTTFVTSPTALVLGMTEADLFSPPMNFVFGIAGTGRALVSTFRLRPEFYGVPSNPDLYHLRVFTEAVHELGHAMGLPHCEFPGCVMYFSNWIGDTDRKGPKFCFRCGKRIERLAEVGWE